MFSRVGAGKPHLADRERSPQLPLDFLESEVDERVRKELLDAVSGKPLTLNGLGHKQRRDLRVTQESREGKHPFAEVLRRRVVRTDRAQGVDDETFRARLGQGRLEEVLKLIKSDNRLPILSAGPNLPQVDQEKDAPVLQRPKVQPNPGLTPFDVRPGLLAP